MRTFPPSTLFAAREDVEISVSGQTSERQSVELDGNPFALTAHAKVLLDRGDMIAPLVVSWNYTVRDARTYSGWLATKDILLTRARLGSDQRLLGVTYGGTYCISPAEPETRGN
ncbi:MAG TPA: hypothetical protein VMX97_12110, partial [Hyphomicrobiaceae bacterium]|nr:hypothetical protein [Hyphomicrobiaceae bacterium]